MRRTLAATLLSAALMLALAGPGCAQEPSHAGNKRAAVAYKVSGNGREEILTVRLRGGAERMTADYRLYGDGRLVRQIVDKGSERVMRTDEVELSAQQIDAVLRPLVDARLPELTKQRARQAAGGHIPVTEDGGEVLVHFQFERYEGPGRAAGPLVADIELQSPGNLARNYPDFAEAQAMTALPQQLDAHLPQTVYQAINEVYQGLAVGPQQ